ncbi:T9SS C-terminal target domain-containing protein, partial [bacterium]
NPFNPATSIKYNISKSGFVSLRIFDISGKQLGKFINTNQSPGEYSINYDASSLSSGVYFYSLEVNGKVMGAKKMTVLK